MNARAIFTVSGCHGISPKTGKRVGKRHRWSGAKWGEGRCDYCYRTLDQVLKKEVRRG